VYILTGGTEFGLGGQPVPGADDPHALRLGRALRFNSNGASSRLSVGPFVWQMRKLLKSLSLDVLHVHAPLDPVLPLMAASCAPCPVVGTFHASFEPSAGFEALYRHNPLARHAALRMSRRIAVSAEARRCIERYFPGEYSVIPNGVDLQRFAPDVSTASHGEDRPLQVLFVGRPDPRKGLGLLVEAHARLIAQGLDTELVLCGVDHAQAEPWLHTLGAEARARVKALGYVPPDELPRHYASADVFCSPATAGESQGVVLLEAMASGLTCVCFDIRGYHDVVTHEGTGLLVTERSASALASALAHLLRDSGLRARLGAAGLRAARRYAWPAVAQAIETQLLAACSQRTPSDHR
jgi:phosphatidylinositol alpha-mannosyltransferase